MSTRRTHLGREYHRDQDIHSRQLRDNLDLGAATQFLVESSLQQWLGDVILVEALEVETEDSTLRVTVQYVVRRTEQRAVARFERGGAA